jgi:hypothetical protein
VLCPTSTIHDLSHAIVKLSHVSRIFLLRQWLRLRIVQVLRDHHFATTPSRPSGARSQSGQLSISFAQFVLTDALSTEKGGRFFIGPRGSLGEEAEERIALPEKLLYAAKSVSHDVGNMQGGLNALAVKDKGFTKGGRYYMPLSEAAPLALANRTTLFMWVSRRVKVGGKPLDVLDFPQFHQRYYISEESVRRLEQRFLRWPSRKPAGAVDVGSGPNGSGYTSLPRAAKVLNIPVRKLHRWGAGGNTPLNRPLDIIQCSISSNLYIRESEIAELKMAPSRPRQGRPPAFSLKPHKTLVMFPGLYR